MTVYQLRRVPKGLMVHSVDVDIFHRRSQTFCSQGPFHMSSKHNATGLLD